MARGEAGESLRERLIRAGIEEIAAHGIADFSLRRVANACQVSCAAPYRHFKNREDFIGATVAYINSQWGLLRDNILRLYKDDPPRQLRELCIAYIRFLVANDNYRAALLASGERPGGDDRIATLLHACAAAGEGEGALSRRLYAIRALIYGTVSMLESGELPNEEASFDMIRATVGAIISGGNVAP